MTEPYLGQQIIRGFVRTNSLVGGVWSLPTVTFDSQTYVVQGSKVFISTLGSNAINTTYAPGPPAGFTAAFNPIVTAGTPVVSSLAGTISSPEPIRIRVQATGYGPRGAVKTLEAIVQKNFFNGLAAPATLTLIGPPSTTCPSVCPATTFTFDPGSSTGTTYSGEDYDNRDTIIPPIGTSGQTNLDTVNNSVDGLPPHPYNGTVTGVPTDISNNVPPYLTSPAALDATVKSLQNQAAAEGRYFSSGVQPPSIGDFATGRGITFCDGDCELGPNDGGGILVVTGKLTLRGGFGFRGIIIVTGQGGVDRRGSGNATIYGNIIVAPYTNSSVYPVSEPVGSAFLAPQYNLSGGGTGGVQFSSTAINNSLLAVNNIVLGVVEK